MIFGHELPDLGEKISLFAGLPEGHAFAKSILPSGEHTKIMSVMDSKNVRKFTSLS